MVAQRIGRSSGKDKSILVCHRNCNLIWLHQQLGVTHDRVSVDLHDFRVDQSLLVLGQGVDAGHCTRRQVVLEDGVVVRQSNYDFTAHHSSV